jgi:hypothetical protein
LTNLDKVPKAGVIVVVAFPKPKGGSGFPARLLANALGREAASAYTCKVKNVDRR